jgi:hypothetical protein
VPPGHVSIAGIVKFFKRVAVSSAISAEITRLRGAFAEKAAASEKASRASCVPVEGPGRICRASTRRCVRIGGPRVSAAGPSSHVLQISSRWKNPSSLYGLGAQARVHATGGLAVPY